MGIPSANPYSINTKKRFWCTDNTDISRMFLGYDLGETTQRMLSDGFREIGRKSAKHLEIIRKLSETIAK